MRITVTQPITFHAIIVAGGQGLRTGLHMPKQFVALKGRPVLEWSAAAFALHPSCQSLIIVVPSGQEHHAASQLNNVDATVVSGGATRQASVRAGLAALPTLRDNDIIMVHDAARPGLSQEVIDRLLEAFADAAISGAVPALAVADTLAFGDGRLGAVVPRDGLVRIQTPQAFRAKALISAHAQSSGDGASDDAQIVRATGGTVAIVAGDAKLEKITHAGDLALVEAIVGHGQPPQCAQSRVAVGSGFDVHRLVAGDGLWLGGVFIGHDKSLEGHSDADVALHAITDAVLGTISDGDIGSHFPPGDAQWRGVSSDQFLKHAVRLVEQQGGTITHIDCTIICEQPKVGPHRADIRARIADIAQLPISHVSVKATTTERLGFTGRSEGVAAQATVTVMLPMGEHGDG